MKFRRPLVVVNVSIALAMGAGCERPGDRTPAGFVEHCYGGSAQMARNWVCSDDRLVVTVEGGESDWPVLAGIVSEYGRSHGLQFFDTSRDIPNYVRALGLSVCSSEGLFINVDKRIYSDASKNGDGKRIRAEFRTYRDSFAWQQLAQEFEAAFRQSWTGPVQVEWPEAVPASKKTALPDSVKTCVEAQRERDA